MSTSTGSGKRKFKWILVPVGILLVLVYQLGIGGLLPRDKWAKNGMRSLAFSVFEDRVEDAKKAPTFHESARIYDGAKVELKDNQNSIEQYLPPCPQATRWEDNLKRMDLTGCYVGNTIWPQLKDPYEVQRYSVTFYKYGKGAPQTELENKFGKQLIRIESNTVIEVMRQSPHFVANEVSPGIYDLGGEVKWTHLGDADAVTLELQ